MTCEYLPHRIQIIYLPNLDRKVIKYRNIFCLFCVDLAVSLVFHAYLLFLGVVYSNKGILFYFFRNIP